MRFTVRRPPIGEVSPCCHRPSGGDVARSVHIGVAPPGSAGFALEDRLALAIFDCDVPARGASLRRVRSRDLLDPAHGLILQTRDEQAPTTSADRTVEPTFPSHSSPRVLGGTPCRARHRANFEKFDSDHIEPPREIGGGLLDPVLASIRLASFHPRDRPFRLRTTLGTRLATGQSLLQHPQSFRLTEGQPRCVQQLAGRQRSRYNNSAVNTDHAAIAWTGDRLGDVGERHMPSARLITGNPIGLRPVRHRPRQPKPHPPHLRHPNPTEAAVEPLDMMWSQSDLPKPFMHTGFTPPRLAMRAVEKELHGLSEIPQRLLLHRLTSGAKPLELGSGLGQLRTLLQIAGSLSARPPVLLLLDRQIPHIPRVSAVRRQYLLLLRRRQQAEPRHNRTVTATTDAPAQSTSVLSRSARSYTDVRGFSRRRHR